MDMSRADNCQKLTNFPISSPKPDLHNINAHTKFSENSLKFTEAIIQKQKYWQTDIQQTDGGMDRPMWYHNTLPRLCGRVKDV